MLETKVINSIYRDYSDNLRTIVVGFKSTGEPFGNQERNSIKLFELNGQTLNVKSFKIPNFVNKVVYRFFRKSKAERSYTYANKLLELGIKTPEPIAYFEYTTPLFFNKSYYISQHLEVDLTYRELTMDFNYPDHENILRAFTRFTFDLHQKEINFLDHSPGNTLIIKRADDYEFYLVDLNRMEFKPLSFNERIKNFAKLTIHKSMVEVMSDEYAKCINKPYEEILDLMWEETQKFQEKYWRKQRLKKKLKFWKQ